MSPLLAPPWKKFGENPLLAPPRKNPSDAHVCKPNGDNCEAVTLEKLTRKQGRKVTNCFSRMDWNANRKGSRLWWKFCMRKMLSINNITFVALNTFVTDVLAQICFFRPQLFACSAPLQFNGLNEPGGMEFLTCKSQCNFKYVCKITFWKIQCKTVFGRKTK